METKLKHAQLDNNKLMNEIDEASQKQSLLNDEISELKGQSTELRAEISQLEAKIKLLEDELATARITAAVAGTGAVAAGTVADVGSAKVSYRFWSFIFSFINC